MAAPVSSPDKPPHNHCDESPNFRVIHAARPVAEGWPDVDHGVELEPVTLRKVRVEVDPPRVFLPGTAVEKLSLLIRMHLSVEKQDATLCIDDPLNQITESSGRHLPKFIHADRILFRTTLMRQEPTGFLQCRRVPGDRIACEPAPGAHRVHPRPASAARRAGPRGLPPRAAPSP